MSDRRKHDVEIELVGPGGAGKSTIGALLAERLEVAFFDLDRIFASRVGDISEYISRRGYAYARENIDLRELMRHVGTFVLLPSLNRDVCAAETVRRQIARPFGRSPAEEEAVIRERFDLYMALPMRKIETMRPVAGAVDEIVSALALSVCGR